MQPSDVDIYRDARVARQLVDSEGWEWVREYMREQLVTLPRSLDAASANPAQYAEHIGLMKAYLRILALPEDAIRDAIEHEKDAE